MDLHRLTAAGASLALHAVALTAVLTLALAPAVLQAPQPLEVSLIAPPEPLRVATAPVHAETPAPTRASPVAAPPSRRPARAPKPPPPPRLVEPARMPLPQVAAYPASPRPPTPEPVVQVTPSAQAPVPSEDRESTTSREAAASRALSATAAPAGTTSGGDPVAAHAAVAASASAPRSTPRVDASWDGNTPPPYPRMALRMGDQGEVRLDVRVGIDGRVLDVRLRQSSGSALLDHTAIDTVRRWRFKPATVDGRPVAEWYRDWRWVFRLEG